MKIPVKSINSFRKTIHEGGSKKSPRLNMKELNSMKDFAN